MVPTWNPFIALMATCADSELSNDTKPKHLDKFVCLSMKTLAEITFPNGRKVDAKSVSVNSCGKWYMKRLQPSGPVKKEKKENCREISITMAVGNIIKKNCFYH